MEIQAFTGLFKARALSRGLQFEMKNGVLMIGAPSQNDPPLTPTDATALVQWLEKADFGEHESSDTSISQEEAAALLQTLDNGGIDAVRQRLFERSGLDEKTEYPAAAEADRAPTGSAPSSFGSCEPSEPAQPTMTTEMTTEDDAASNEEGGQVISFEPRGESSETDQGEASDYDENEQRTREEILAEIKGIDGRGMPKNPHEFTTDQLRERRDIVAERKRKREEKKRQQQTEETTQPSEQGGSDDSGGEEHPPQPPVQQAEKTESSEPPQETEVPGPGGVPANKVLKWIEGCETFKEIVRVVYNQPGFGTAKAVTSALNDPQVREQNSILSREPSAQLGNHAERIILMDIEDED